MHELSLAMSVMDIAARECAKHSGAALSAIEIEVGELAGVEHETFRSALESVIRRSATPGAVAEMSIIPAEARCMECDTVFRPEGLFPQCPACGSSACRITAGTEFRVTALRFRSDA